jgi:hypothetical protein
MVGMNTPHIRVFIRFKGEVLPLSWILSSFKVIKKREGSEENRTVWDRKKGRFSEEDGPSGRYFLLP